MQREGLQKIYDHFQGTSDFETYWKIPEDKTNVIIIQESNKCSVCLKY